MRTNLFLIALLAVTTTALAEETVLLDSLDISRATQDFGQPRAKRSVNRNPLTIAGKSYANGFGTHAVSYLKLEMVPDHRRVAAQLIGVPRGANKHLREPKGFTGRAADRAGPTIRIDSISRG